MLQFQPQSYNTLEKIPQSPIQMASPSSDLTAGDDMTSDDISSIQNSQISDWQRWPHTLDTKILAQQHTQAASPKMLTNWTWMVFAVLLLCEKLYHVSWVACLLSSRSCYTPCSWQIHIPLPPRLIGNLVEVTAICAILKISEDYCLPQKVSASYSQPIELLGRGPPPVLSPSHPSPAFHHNLLTSVSTTDTTATPSPWLHTNTIKLCIHLTKSLVYTLQ